MMRNPFLSFLVPLLALTASSGESQTNFTILRSFLGTPDGGAPKCTLVEGKDGMLYGTTVIGGASNAGTVFKISRDGSAFTTLNDTLGGPAPSAGPSAGLVIDQAGNFYGATLGGGTSNLGTVFKLTPDGKALTTLHSFVGGADGKNPRTSLVLGSDGYLYGTADQSDALSRGTVFKVRPDGSNYSVLHVFTGGPNDGQNPWKIVEGSDGKLYGTTQTGGPKLLGTVFTMKKDGSEYFMLHYFPLFSGDGKIPQSSLFEGSDGALYGTTVAGGGGGRGAGVVFRFTKDLNSYTILHTFDLGSSGGGSFPYGELIEGPDGALYGVTQNGGSTSVGTVYKLNKDGTSYTVLKNFTGANGDGQTPYGGLLYEGGVFYGTTFVGGAAGIGTVYALNNLPFPSLRFSISVFATSNLVHFDAISGTQYDVMRSTDLSSWSTLGTIISPVNASTNFPDLSPPQPAAFYRLQSR
jgi:uncharacterized repeat protein (TIGR03803 family)